MTSDEATGGFRILIVEDDRESGEMLAELLQSAGYDARFAAGGADALAQAASFRPAFVLLDINLSSSAEDGFEVCRQLRSRRGGLLGVVAVTGDVRLDEGQLRAAGFDGLVYKPIDFKRLVALLSNLWAKRAATGS